MWWYVMVFLESLYWEAAMWVLRHPVPEDALGQKRQVEEDASGELYLLKGRLAEATKIH